VNIRRECTCLLVLLVVYDCQRATLIVHAFRLELSDQIKKGFLFIHGVVSVGL
jgi:hypothetical protein